MPRHGTTKMDQYKQSAKARRRTPERWLQIIDARLTRPEDKAFAAGWVWYHMMPGTRATGLWDALRELGNTYRTDLAPLSCERCGRVIGAITNQKVGVEVGRYLARKEQEYNNPQRYRARTGRKYRTKRRAVMLSGSEVV